MDQLIALHERKLALLKQKKQRYLQKLFPQKDAKMPQLRFKGFNDVWHKIPLKQTIVKEWKGKVKEKDLTSGKVIYLDTEYLNNCNNAFYSNAKKDVENYDILILWDGSNAGTVYSHVNGALGSTLKAYQINKDKYNSEFIYQN